MNWGAWKRLNQRNLTSVSQDFFFLCGTGKARNMSQILWDASSQFSINKYHGYKTKINIINDIEFKQSRDVLSAKRKQLKSKGLGNRKRKAERATDEEIHLLYSKHLLRTCKYLQLSEHLSTWCNLGLLTMRGRS